MSFSRSKLFFLIGIIIVVLAAIPLTVYLTQHNQETRSRATPATKLYFANPSQLTPATGTIKVASGNNVILDIAVDPGTNQVSFAKLTISYDATKLATIEGSFTPQFADRNNPQSTGFTTMLEGPKYKPGTITVTLSIGADSSKTIQSPTKIATLTFKALESTNSTPTQVKFLDGQTQILSYASTDQSSENVLSTTTPAAISITGSATPTAVPTLTSLPTPVANQPPTCTSLTLDRAATGIAPYSVVLTASGNDTDDTISKVTFNFGDGAFGDVTQSGGVGTKSINAQVSHTYNNPGTYQASAIITDSKGGISSNTCTQTISVTAGTGGTTGIGGAGTTGSQASGSATPIAQATQTIAASPTLVPSGPSDMVIKAGIVSTIIAALGTLVFFAL